MAIAICSPSTSKIERLQQGTLDELRQLRTDNAKLAQALKDRDDADRLTRFQEPTEKPFRVVVTETGIYAVGREEPR